MKRGGTRRPVRALARGDTIGVVAPGFAVEPAALAAGVTRLRRMGFRVRLGPHVLERDGYLAGDDESRAADLRTMLADPAVAAIWFARGGYGTARLLDRLPWRTLRAKPRILIGYSDLTALFGAAVARGALCLHGPLVSELGDASRYHAPSLRALLRGRSVTLPLRARQVLVPGRGTGRLLGGNLTVLAHLLGTPYVPDLRGAVLLLEEVGEETYRIDRALNHLRLAGALGQLAGVLVGRLSPPARRAFPPDRPLRRVLSEYLVPLGVPVAVDLPVGHLPGKWTLPLGGRVTIDTRARRLRFAP